MRFVWSRIRLSSSLALCSVSFPDGIVERRAGCRRDLLDASMKAELCWSYVRCNGWTLIHRLLTERRMSLVSC
jgi:hypothetical protein